jgi:cytochrome c556
MMNERIRELAARAGMIKDEYNGFDRNKLTQAEQKFAELIVRECMSLIKADPEDGDAINCISNLAIMKLEKYFGVE